MSTSRLLKTALPLMLLLFSLQALAEGLRIGSGIHDITGPAAERGMLGYADLGQVTQGILTRLFARAFVIEDPSNNSRIALVVCDLGMVFDAVKEEVLKKLEASLPGIFTETNILISATHTHSGPGGFAHHDLFNITTLGFDRDNFNIITEGIFQAIFKAYNNLSSGKIFVSQGNLAGASHNRSIVAYLQNPDNRDYTEETDQSLHLFRFKDNNEIDIGVLNWFAVHPTCMSKKNKLISADNKGYAALAFEKSMATNYKADKTFVAAFSNANEGDSSPYEMGPDGEKSVADGVGDLACAESNGLLQYQKVKTLWEQADLEIFPRVLSKLVWVKMEEYEISPQFGGGNRQKLCNPAMGYSFAAGAEDGRSEVPGFVEGMKQGDNLPQNFPIEGAALILQFAIGGSKRGSDCHYPKPILMATNEDKPDLLPDTIPFQLIVIGQIAIAGVPGEMTTMAGRRLKNFLLSELRPMGVEFVVISGLSNDYSGYVTTIEEYQSQQYEGGFTIFGPHTHEGYLQIFSELASAMRENREITIDPHRPQRISPLHDFQPGVLFDDKRLWEKFGKTLKQPKKHYLLGEVPTASFRSGHPKNNLGNLDSFLEVQKFEKSEWVTVQHDWDTSSAFQWVRENAPDCLGCSIARVYWRTSEETPKGIYRFRHFGFWKSGWTGKLKPYVGTSAEFLVE